MNFSDDTHAEESVITINRSGEKIDSIVFQEFDAPEDAKKWKLVIKGGVLTITLLNDANIEGTVLTITRAGVKGKFR